MKRFVTLVLLLAVAVGILCAAGCSTYQGAGKDVENLGESMQGK